MPKNKKKGKARKKNYKSKNNSNINSNTSDTASNQSKNKDQSIEMNNTLANKNEDKFKKEEIRIFENEIFCLVEQKYEICEFCVNTKAYPQ